MTCFWITRTVFKTAVCKSFLLRQMHCGTGTSEGEISGSVFDPGLLDFCNRLWPIPMLLCGPVALLPRYLLGFNPGILDHEDFPDEDVWFESRRGMVFFSPGC